MFVRRSLVVYDGSNSLFRAAAEAATRQSDDVRAVRWDAEPVQAFLEAQFDDRPFAFIVVDGDVVHAGEATVEWLLDRTDVGTAVAESLTRAYATGGDAVGRLVHGRPIADLSGTFELTDEAATHLDALREVREIPVQDASDGSP
jgi:hypothetical protein